jgi:hypothetical protein
MLKHGDFKTKTSLPISKRFSNSFEYPIIHLLPDAAAGKDDYLNEAWTIKTFLCNNKNISYLSRIPRNLEVIPNSSVEHAVEKEMPPVLKYIDRTKNTRMI